MGIEINTSNSKSESLVINPVQNLINLIASDLIDKGSIMVTDLENIPNLFPVNSIPNVYEFYKRNISFALTQPKIFSDGKEKQLITLNIEFINELDLTDKEIEAIIAHELGHIFNPPIDDLSSSNEQKEFYADYFVKVLGLKENLISSMKKYLNTNGTKNQEMIKERIQKLYSNEVFINPLNDVFINRKQKD